MKSGIAQYLTLTNFSAFILSVALFLLFVAPLYTPITMSGWVFFGLLATIVKKQKLKINIELVLPIALYGLYALSVFWSDDQADALFDLEVKMSLAIVPFIFMLIRYHLLQLKMLLYASLLGLISGLAVIFIVALKKSIVLGSFHGMFYTELSPDIHPSYFAFYVNITMGFLLVDYVTGKLGLFKAKWIYLVLFVALATASIFLLSKLGVLTTLLLMLSLIVIWIRQKKMVLAISVFCFGLLCGGGIYFKSNYVQGRVDEFFEGIGEGPSDHYLYSTSVRIEVWKVAFENFCQRPLIGYGSGDVDEVMQKKYIEKGVKKAPDLRLNAHNQLLQTGLAVGIPGLTLLILMLFLPIWNLRKNFFFAATLSLIALLFFLTESVLETQAGVLGFILFYSMFNSLHQIFNDTHEVAHINPVLPS